MAMGGLTSSRPIGPGPSFVCLNDGAGRFTSSCIPIPSESATSIVPADFDKDGFIDLAVPSRDGGQSRIYFNDGKAGFARTTGFGPADAAARAAAAADFNKDGSVDLAVGDEKAASLVVYLNDGKGHLTPGFQIAEPQGEDPLRDCCRRLERRRESGHRFRIHGRTARALFQRRNRAAVRSRGAR